jgi:hypothetical protein
MNEREHEKEREMKVTKYVVRKHAGAALALFACFAAISPSASAKDRAVKPVVQPASVIAHLPLPGPSVTELALQQRGNKQYLYVEQASHEGFAIVDVTKPNQPNIIKREAWPNEASTGTLQMVGGRLALAEAPDTFVAEPVSRTETLNVLDLNDPANPRTILRLSGVTSTLADDAHNLIYITNSDGLWILKIQSEQAAFDEPHACRTEDATNDLASCQ